MKKKTNLLAGQRGFSLVELLVVIAVIAIIAAIAIPNIANITSQATFAKDQRNAQNIASVAAAAIAAGYSGSTWVGTGTAGVAAAITDLLSGSISVPGTAGKGNMTFSVSTMTQPEIDGASKFLTLSPVYTTTTAPQLNYSSTAAP